MVDSDYGDFVAVSIGLLTASSVWDKPVDFFNKVLTKMCELSLAVLVWLLQSLLSDRYSEIALICDLDATYNRRLAEEKKRYIKRVKGLVFHLYSVVALIAVGFGVYGLYSHEISAWGKLCGLLLMPLIIYLLFCALMFVISVCVLVGQFVRYYCYYSVENEKNRSIEYNREVNLLVDKMREETQQEGINQESSAQEETQQEGTNQEISAQEETN